jgi:hypothetical protein
MIDVAFIVAVAEAPCEAKVDPTRRGGKQAAKLLF